MHTHQCPRCQFIRPCEEDHEVPPIIPPQPTQFVSAHLHPDDLRALVAAVSEPMLITNTGVMSKIDNADLLLRRLAEIRIHPEPETQPLFPGCHRSHPHEGECEGNRWNDVAAHEALEKENLKAQVRTLVSDLAGMEGALRDSQESNRSIRTNLAQAQAEVEAAGAEKERERIIKLVCSEVNDLLWIIPEDRRPFLHEPTLRAAIEKGGA